MSSRASLHVVTRNKLPVPDRNWTLTAQPTAKYFTDSTVGTLAEGKMYAMEKYGE
jgi:hypothetical protein